MALTSHLWSSLAIAAYILLLAFEEPTEDNWVPGAAAAALVGFGSALLLPSPAHWLADWFWYDPTAGTSNLQVAPAAQTPIRERMPPRSRDIPLLISGFVLLLSLVGVGLFILYTSSKRVVNMQLSVLAFFLVSMRLAVMPMLRSLFLTFVLARSKRSRIFDSLIWFSPSTVLAHDIVM